MVTPILFNITTILGLWPSGEDYKSSAKTDFKFSSNAYSTFIGDRRGSGGIVDACEHIAVLTYWLCCYVFCPRGIKISKMYIYMATLLHEGVNVCLNKLILESLYESMGHAYEDFGEESIISKLWALSGCYSYGSTLLLLVPSTSKSPLVLR